MTRDAPLQCSVWWASPDPVVGSETAKRRPVVVMGRDALNARRRTVIVVPLSSRTDAHPPVTVSVTCRGSRAIAIVDQIRAIDKSRLLEFIEVMALGEFDAIRDALAELT